MVPSDTETKTALLPNPTISAFLSPFTSANNLGYIKLLLGSLSDHLSFSTMTELKEKSVIQVFDTKTQHVHGQIKVKNVLKRTFIGNYNFTFDELYYFFKINKHFEIFKKLKKKMPNYIFKSIINLFLLRFTQSIYYFSKVLGVNEKIPIYLSAWLPHLLLFLICLNGVVRLNEK